MATEVVEQPVELLITVPAVAARSTVWRYDPADPYAVQVEFPGRVPVVWTFARDLLAAGLHGPAGRGDVQVLPDGTRPRLLLLLHSPDGDMTLAVARADVERFLAASFRLVPAGAERAPDVDTAVARVLAEEARDG